jgi:hypothetical protein
VLIIPIDFDVQSVMDELIEELGRAKADEVARITEDCVDRVADSAELETCVKNNLPPTFSTAEKDKAWNILFVIVG